MQTIRRSTAVLCFSIIRGGFPFKKRKSIWMARGVNPPPEKRKVAKFEYYNFQYSGAQVLECSIWDRRCCVRFPARAKNIKPITGNIIYLNLSKRILPSKLKLKTRLCQHNRSWNIAQKQQSVSNTWKSVQKLSKLSNHFTICIMHQNWSDTSLRYMYVFRKCCKFAEFLLSALPALSA